MNISLPELLLLALILRLLTLGFLEAVRTWRVRRLMVQKLRRRTPRSSEDFGRFYFGPDATSAEVAASIRDILETNVGFSLAGLHPEDRLEDVMTVPALGNPCLFMEIEDRLDVDLSVSSWLPFKQRVEGVVTFRDLVDLVLASPRKESAAVE